MKLQGPYLALLGDQPLSPVDGIVCGLLSSRQLDRLVVYEADKSQLRSCLINIFNNGSIEKTVDGVSFMWNGREDELWEGTLT